jgi:hypothetical protein
MTNEKPTFPDDLNGAVLRRLWETSDDLSKPREFEFGVALEHEEAALNFVVALLKQGMKVSFCPTEEGINYCDTIKKRLPRRYLSNPNSEGGRAMKKSRNKTQRSKR